MGKGNAAVKQWMSNRARFADLFNGVVFQGKQVVRAEELEIAKGESDIIVSDKLKICYTIVLHIQSKLNNYGRNMVQRRY